MEATEKKHRTKILDVVEPPAAADARDALATLGVVTKEQREAERARQAELLGAKPAEVIERGKVVKLSAVIESKKNHRKAFGDLDALADSIERHGQLTDVDVVQVNPDVYEVIAGARRVRAMKKRGMKEVRVTVYAATPEQAAELRVIENLQREDLKPLEEAENFEELEQLGYTRKTIAEAAKKTVGWVHSRMLLLKLSPKARALLNAPGGADGSKLPESVAYHLARYPADQQDKALKSMEGYSGPLKSSQYNASWDDDDVICRARVAIDFLHEHVAASLKSPAFDPDDETLNPANPVACKACPSNSENQPRVEGEEKPKHGMCFNMVCFKAKTEAAWKLTAAKAEAKGAVVLTVADAKSALSGIDYRSGSRYVRANATFDHDPKKRTVAQLVAELPPNTEPDEKGKGGFTRPTEVVAPDPETKKPVKLFERADVERAFAEHFKWAKKLTAERDSARPNPEAAKREKEKHERRMRVSLDVLRKVIDGMRSKTIVGDVRAIAVNLANRPLPYDLNRLIESQEEGDGMASLFGFKQRKELTAWIEKKAKLPELIAFIYVATMGHDYGNAFGGYSAEVKEAAARYKLDPKKLEQLDEKARAEKPEAEAEKPAA